MEPTRQWTWKRIVLLAAVIAMLGVVGRNIYLNFSNQPDSRLVYLLVLGLCATYIALLALPATREFFERQAKRVFFAAWAQVVLAIVWTAAYVFDLVPVSPRWAIFIGTAMVLVAGFMIALTRYKRSVGVSRESMKKVDELLK